VMDAWMIKGALTLLLGIPAIVNGVADPEAIMTEIVLIAAAVGGVAVIWTKVFKPVVEGAAALRRIYVEIVGDDDDKEPGLLAQVRAINERLAEGDQRLDSHDMRMERVEGWMLLLAKLFGVDPPTPKTNGKECQDHPNAEA
jgi:hypothetical protein